MNQTGTYQNNTFDSPDEELFWQTAWEEFPELIYDFGLTPQLKISNYRVDFAIPDKHIVVELDGKTYHSTEEQKKKDRVRQKEIENLGWRVIRFSGEEVYYNPDGCVYEVLRMVT